MQDTLWLATLFSALTGVLYAYVGWRLSARKVSPDASLAQGMFVLWWHAVAATSFIGAATNLLYLADKLPIWLYQAITHLALLLLLAGLFGLLYYLVYLYTGRRRLVWPMGFLYVAMYAWVVGLLYQIGTPETLTDNGWAIQRLPAVQMSPAVSMVFVLLLVGPQVGAAIAYARLYPKASDLTQRYRIALVAGSIVVWFGAALLASALQVGSGADAPNPIWQYASRVISVLGAVAFLLAYRPPKAWRVRWGLRSIDDEKGPAVAA